MKKIFGIALSFCMASNTFAFAVDKQAPIDYLMDKGIITGDESGTIHENDFITRGELCKLIAEAANLEINGEPKAFTDISDHWAKEYIDILSSNNYISGISDSEFSPDGYVTYEQAVAIISRISGCHTNNYPYEHMAYALDIGLSDNVPWVIGEKIRRFEVAQLLFNGMSNDYFEKAYENTADSYYEQVNSYTVGAQPTTAMTSGGGGAGYAGGGMPLAGYESERYPYDFNTEEYSNDAENIFKSSVDSPLSTFALDVDTASYSNLRRKLVNGALPEPGVVRTEELVNYFKYDFKHNGGESPILVDTEVSKCPWNEDNLLAMISVSGKNVEKEDAPASNLVFLIDVSGSMYNYNKLPHVQKSLLFLTESLREQDRITIVTYAGNSAVALDTVSGSEKEKINEAVMSLRAGGSTNGAEGIETAYEKALEAFIDGGNNRVIICSDGDFNVGVTSEASLEELITKKRESGVFLSVLGYGMWNYKDNKMETLADCGNGNYAYIDNLKEAKKVLVDDMMSTLYTVAKDVKLQVEFNPTAVLKYRLIGYENRLLENEEFTDDTKDAGELGAGQSMIALYEIVPNTDGEMEESNLKYQNKTAVNSNELMTIHARYKLPDGDTSDKADDTIVNDISDSPSESFNFASSVAEFSLILNDSAYKANASLENAQQRALENIGDDEYGYRSELAQLIDLTRWLHK